MKKIIIATSIATLALTGCANMNRQQQASLGSLGGAAVGSGIGAAMGGSEGAAIGAGAGALLGGIAAYSLSTDPYTQLVSQQANAWQREIGAQPGVTQATQIIENGKKLQKINSQKFLLSEAQMVVGNQLSPKVKRQLMLAKQEAQKVGGRVQVLCPPNAPQAVLNDFKRAGISYTQDAMLRTGYAVLMSK